MVVTIDYLVLLASGRAGQGALGLLPELTPLNELFCLAES